MNKKGFFAVGFVGIFCLGAIGGIWAQAFLLPFLASSSAFQEWQFIKEWNERITVVREVQEIVISENDAVERIVETRKSVVVGVQSTNNVQTLNGSGFIVTSDGFVLTLASVVPQDYSVYVYLNENEDPVKAQVLKRDFTNNVAVLRIEKKDLPTAGFTSGNEVALGSKLIMLAQVVEGGELVSIVHVGGVRSISEQRIRTNITDKGTLQGSPIFDSAGSVVGISEFEPSGRLVVIPSFILKDFLGF